MLQDRPYMRESYDRPRTSILVWLVSLIGAVFIIQSILARLPGIHNSLDLDLGLSSVGLRAGHVWTLLTYGFLHDTGNLLQVLGYVVAIYFVGRELLPILGNGRFIGFYLSALAVGGLAYTGTHWLHPELLVGASAAVSALIILYACFFPNREITLLLFFVLPVNVKPKYVAYVLLALDLFGFGFYEVFGATSPFGAAHSAHLGGMLVGWLYFRYVHDSEWSLASARAELELPRWMKQRAAVKAPPAPAFGVNLGDRGHLRAEVDRILDKINSHGFGSLSAEEKKVLDGARDLIGRR